MNIQPTVAFWGAGATASLGIRTTKEQNQFVRHLAPVESPPKPLRDRVRNALGAGPEDLWRDALCDLLTILGDDQKPEEARNVDDRALRAMAGGSTSASEADLRQRVLHLRSIYDWPTLTAIIRACPGSREPVNEGRFKVNDLLNILDLYGGEHGFRAVDEVPVCRGTRDRARPMGPLLAPEMVRSAKNALKMLLQTMFFIDWQVCCKDDEGQLALYREFAVALARRMQKRGVELAGERFERPSFYLGDLSFVSMNYDPVGLWCQMIANGDMNGADTVPHVGTPARKLQIFGYLWRKINTMT